MIDIPELKCRKLYSLKNTYGPQSMQYYNNKHSFLNSPNHVSRSTACSPPNMLYFLFWSEMCTQSATLVTIHLALYSFPQFTDHTNQQPLFSLEQGYFQILLVIYIYLTWHCITFSAIPYLYNTAIPSESSENFDVATFTQ